MPGEITQEFGKREPDVHDWGASRSRSSKGQREDHSNKGERGERSSKEGGRLLGATSSGVSNLLHAAAEDSSTMQRGAPPLRPPTSPTAPTRRAHQPPQFYGHSFRDREGRDRQAPFHEAPYHKTPLFLGEPHPPKKRFRDAPYSEKRCPEKYPFRIRDRDEASGGSSSGGRQAAAAGCSMEQGITDGGRARSAFGNASGSVPVAMAANFATVDSDYYSDSREAENEDNRRRFMERSRQMDYRYACDHRVDLHADGHHDTDNRHVDGSANHDGPPWLSPNRTGSRKRLANNNGPVDNGDSHMGIHGMENRGHQGKLYREGNRSEHHRRRFQGDEPHDFPHPEGRIYPSGEESDWVRRKLDGNGRTAQPPTH